MKSKDKFTAVAGMFESVFCILGKEETYWVSEIIAVCQIILS